MKKIIFGVVGVFVFITVAYAQTIPPAPKFTVFKPDNTTPKDLIQNMVNEVSSRVESLSNVNIATNANGFKYKNLYTKRGSAVDSWVRNPDVWTNNVIPLDLTGHSPWYGDINAPGAYQGGAYQGGGTLISPIHIISATHITNQIPVGKKVVFVTKDNQKIVRTVVKSKVVPNTSSLFPDMTIALLDEEVPSTITHYPIISTDAWRQALKNEGSDPWGDTRGSIPVIYLDQEDRVSIGVTSKENLVNTSYTSFGFGQSEGRLSKYFENTILGDSSNPMFVVIGGKLALMSLFSMPGTGSDYANLIGTINSTMASLGGGYKVSEFDLSGFTSGATKPRPTTPYTDNFDYSTDKATYRVGDVVKMRASFTLKPEWVAWFKEKGETTGQISLQLHDNVGAVLVVGNIPFSTESGQVVATYDWQTPATLPALSGKRMKLTASVLMYTLFESKFKDNAAVFERGYNYTVGKTGAGYGTVIGIGVNCGDDCTGIIPNGTTVGLNALPAIGSKFKNWSGACSGTNELCTLTLSPAGNVHAIANFELGPVKVNTQPTAEPVSATVTNNTALITLLATDREGDPITFKPSTLKLPNGTLARTAEGKYTYTLKSPAPTARITDTFTFVANDGMLDSNVETVSITYTPAAPVQFSLNTTVIGQGSVSGTGINCNPDCSELINTGSTVSLSAVPKDGYVFAGWSGACTNATGLCTLLVNANKNVTATFAVANTAPTVLPMTVVVTNNIALISLSGSDTQRDALTFAPSTLTLPNGTLARTAEGKYTYTLKSPAPTVSTSDTFTYTASDGKLTSTPATVTVNYTLVPPTIYRVSVSKTGNGTVMGIGVNCGDECTEDLPKGSVLALNATQAMGYTFAGWSGACTGMGVCSVTVDGNKTVSARFTAVPPTMHSLFTVTSGNGTVTGTGIDCGQDCQGEFTKDTIATLTATPDAGYTFVGWSAVCSGTGPCNVTMNANKTVGASFAKTNTAPTTQPVTVNTNGAPVEFDLTATDAEKDPVTINIGLQPLRGSVAKIASNKYRYTPTAPLSASPYVDAFNYNATDGKLTSSAARVTINYTPRLFTLTTSKTGNGTVMGIGINCGDECSEELVGGSMHALNAVTAMGYDFAGWSGACTGMGVCNVKMDQNQIVTANFVVKNTAPVAQNGSFTISSPGTTANVILNASDAQNNPLVFTPSILTTPKGTLSRTDEGKYTYTLKTPLPTASFTETITFTATDGKLTSAPATITINYTLIPPTIFTLTASKIGLGTITGTGIACGQDCQGEFTKDTTATLTAVADAGYTFTGWTGACTGTACSVVMNSAKAVTATFVVTNTAPTVQSATYTAVANTIDITLVGSDPQKNAITFSQVGTLKNGTLTKLEGEGKYRYTVTKRSETVDLTELFEFTASDGKLTSNKGIITINIPKTPALPVLDDDKDGILNAQDLCPRTPVSLKVEVNPYGCIKPRLTSFDIKSNLQNDLRNVNSFEVGKTNLGKIQFKDPVSLSRENEQIDLDNNIRIGQKEVEIKSTNVPELNKPATITLYNITEANPRIMKDGVECPPPHCVIDSFVDGTLVFTVTGFSVYTVEETPETPTTPTESAPEPEAPRRRGGGGGGGSSRTTTVTVSNEELIATLTAQLNALIAELNRLTGGSIAGNFLRDLKIGVSHPDVLKLQKLLNAKGYVIATTGPGSPGNESSLYGAKTAAAVKRFQASKGITTTGNVGPRTRAALNAI